MKKTIITFAGGVVAGALGMKFAPKLFHCLTPDYQVDDELIDEFDELADTFDELVPEPSPEPTKEPTEAPAPSPENGEEKKGGDNNEQ